MAFEAVFIILSVIVTILVKLLKERAARDVVTTGQAEKLTEQAAKRFGLDQELPEHALMAHRHTHLFDRNAMAPPRSGLVSDAIVTVACVEVIEPTPVDGVRGRRSLGACLIQSDALDAPWLSLGEVWAPIVRRRETMSVTLSPRSGARELETRLYTLEPDRARGYVEQMGAPLSDALAASPSGLGLILYEDTMVLHAPTRILSLEDVAKRALSLLEGLQEVEARRAG